MNTNKISNNKIDLFFAVTVLLGAAVYISLIFNNNLWVDEAFTASIIRCPLPEVWSRTAADTLPPFYNFFGKALTVLFGYSAPVMKFGSVLPMIGALILGAFPVRRQFGTLTSALFMAFLLSMPNFYYYAVEIRMYSWGIFCVTGAAVFAHYALSSGRKKYWALFTFFTVLSGYVHHFAFVSAGMLWLFTLILLIFPGLMHKKQDMPESVFKRLRPWALSLFCTFVLYFPCGLLTVYQIKNASSYFSMTPLTVHSFLSDLRFPFVTHFTVLSALILLLAADAIFSGLLHIFAENILPQPALKNSTALAGLIFAAVFYATLFFGYAVSILAGSSMFTARYLVPSLGVFWLGVAVLLSYDVQNIPKIKYLKPIMTSIIIFLIVITGIVTYTSQFKSEYAKGVDEMTAFFDENLGPDDGYIIYENSYQIENCFRYYYPDLKKYDWESARETKGTVWYFAVDGFKKELEEAHTFGYNMQYIEHISFDRYSFDLYRADPISQ
ncbi:Dolichyl-phosphate-mannose-protein mannosyltransferase [Lachnospiraceae bacterium]|nr:Dolichyl-phosphate-mannose-protein mannosyltransferase [Lachnospiraceae bacterium]